MADPDTRAADEDNPFYCPSVPADVFLETVRQRVRRRDSVPEVQDHSLINTPELTHSFDGDNFPSFAKILDRSICEEDLLQLHYRPDHLRDSTHNNDHGNSSLLSASSMHWQQHHALLLDSRLSGVSSRQNSPAVSVTFSGFAAPARREMSIVDVNEGSFELSAKAEKLRFFTNKILDSPEELGRRYASDLAHQVAPSSVKALTSRVCALQDELYGLPIGTESPRGISALVSRLVTVLPGIRLEDKLLASGAETHQRIADTLASHGYMNTRVLNILRTSEIEYLDLSASIGDEGGLNLDSQDVFHVFSKPNSFLFLSEINLANSEIKEADLLHLQNLPRLARLWLASSGIGNEAIFYLTPLKRSLTDLDIAFNSNIDDDAIPALLVLTKLQYLVFQGTCITMVGLRRLARTLKEQKRDMEVEVPRRCEEYISKLSNQYLIQPDPPLITDPEDVSSLTTAAIIRNLTAHSQSGSAKDESERLALRLRSLLETREADLLAKALILQQPLE